MRRWTSTIGTILISLTFAGYLAAVIDFFPEIEELTEIYQDAVESGNGPISVSFLASGIKVILVAAILCLIGVVLWVIALLAKWYSTKLLKGVTIVCLLGVVVTTVIFVNALWKAIPSAGQ